MKLVTLASCILISSIVICVYYYWKYHGMTDVISTVDNNSYSVRDLPDKHAAADMLATIRARLVRLVDLASTTAPGETAGCNATIEQLKFRFDPNALSEIPPSYGGTSYSEGKSQIALCLRSKPEGTMLDINTLMYVAIHELCHVATASYGHDEAFWNNFRWMLRVAVNSGLYQYQDYKANPQKYCGIVLDSAVYVPGRDNER